MTKIINLSEIAGLPLMEMEQFSGRILFDALKKDSVASLYPNLSLIDLDQVDMIDFIEWQSDFVKFMDERGVLILLD